MKPLRIKSRKKDIIPELENKLRVIDIIKSKEFLNSLKNYKTWIIAFFFFTCYVIIFKILNIKGNENGLVTLRNIKHIEIYGAFFIANLIFVLYMSTHFLINAENLSYKPREVLIKVVFYLIVLGVFMFLSPFFKLI